MKFAPLGYLSTQPFTGRRRVFASLVIGLLLSLTVAGQQDDKLRRSKDRIPNSYIVVLTDENSATHSLLPVLIREKNVKDVAARLAGRHGGKVDKVYSSAVTGFSMRMSPAQALALSRDPRVKYVEEDFIFRAAQSQQNAPWGLDRIDQRYFNLNGVYNYDTTGAGVHVYVVDSGIRSTHSQFGGRVVFGADFVGDGQNGNDCDGHGTHVAGIVGGSTFGVAKNVTIHNVRVLGCDGTGTASAVLAGINWITNNRIAPAVANMSLGSDQPSATIENAVANSIAQGIHYALAAGNGDPPMNACGHSPGGRVPTAVTVAASIRGDQIAWFSNYGSCVDIFAPGEDIDSAWNSSDTATARLSGTSMAAPHVAGVIARLLQTSPSASPAQVKGALLTWASRVVVNGGLGSPTGLLYSNTSLTSFPPVSAVRLRHNAIAVPYPAEYTVSGAPDILSTKPGSIQVNINGFSAQEAHHVVIALVHPDGTAMMLQNQQQVSYATFESSYTFSDVGRGGHLGSAITEGWSYRATDTGLLVNFPAPGPGTNYAIPGPIASQWETMSGTFGGKNPNGTWKLFVFDPDNWINHFDGEIKDFSISVNNPPEPYPAPPPPSPSPTPSPTPVPSPTPTGTPTVVYDIVDSFSTTSNPSGVWKYGYPIRFSTDMDIFANSGEPWTGIKSWSKKPGGFCCGMLTKNFGDPLVYYGTIVHDPAYLYMETGPYGEPSAIRWTPPSAGTYLFQGEFRALDTFYGGVHVKIRRRFNDFFDTWSSSLPWYGTVRNFNFSITLAADEYIDFQVGETGSRLYYGAGLRGTITSWNAAPPQAFATIRGRVSNAQGRLLNNVRVTVTHPDGSERMYTTNSAGYFTLRDVPTGNVTVSFARKNGAPIVRQITLVSDLANYDIVF